MKKLPIIFAITYIFTFPLIAMENDDIQLIPTYNDSHRHQNSTTSTTTITTTTTQTSTRKSIARRVDKLDSQINKQYPQKTFLGGFFSQTQLQDEDMLKIVKSIEGHCSDESGTDKLISQLCAKNTFFKTAIDFFIAIARDNIKKVIYKTLDTVTDPKLPQPEPQLDLLPLILKTTIMNRAMQSLDNEYKIKLKVPNKNNILSFDVHAPSGTAVITTEEDKAIHLYNLNEGGTNIKTMHDPKFYQSSVCFDTSGNYIATASTHTSGNSIIEQWDINSPGGFTKTHSYLLKDQHAYYISYYKKNSLVLITADPSSDPSNLNNWQHIMISFKKNGNTVIEGSTNQFCINLNWQETERAPYTAQRHDKRDSILIYKKCSELYLCERAVKNTLPQFLERIPKSKTYKQLTQYEQGIITDKIQQKICDHA